jgi:carboxypeptidase Q
MCSFSANARQLASFLIIVLIAPATLSAQNNSESETIAKIRDEGLNRSQVMDYAWYLTDVIGARLSGSYNMRQSQEWAKEQMNRLGLANTAIEPWGERGANWDVEYVSLHMLEPDYQPVIGYPQAFTPGTDGKVEGRLVIADIRTPEDLDTLRGTLEGLIVLSTPPRGYGPRFTPDAIRHDEGSLDVFVNEGVDRNYERRKEEIWWEGPPKPEGINAAEIEAFYKSEGAAAVLVAAKGGDGTVFVTGRQGHRTDRSLASIENSLPTINVAAEHYGRMYRLVERGQSVVMEMDVQISAEERDLKEYNVFGEIPGTDLADEVVMLGGHLDSWHSGTGATDNAAGSAVVLEAMRILTALGISPRRTIRAALWSAEEGGLKGSRAYVAKQFGNPKDGTTPDYDKFSVYFNMDNGTGQFRGVHLQGNQLVAPTFGAWMAPFHDLNVRTLSQLAKTGSDYVSFDEAGLPAFQFIQDRIEYRSRTWHSNMDVYDKLIPRDLQINAVVLASFVYHAAMADERIPRKPFETSSAE